MQIILSSQQSHAPAYSREAPRAPRLESHAAPAYGTMMRAFFSSAFVLLTAPEALPLQKTTRGEKSATKKPLHFRLKTRAAPADPVPAAPDETPVAQLNADPTSFCGGLSLPDDVVLQPAADIRVGLGGKMKTKDGAVLGEYSRHALSTEAVYLESSTAKTQGSLVRADSGLANNVANKVGSVLILGGYLVNKMLRSILGVVCRASREWELWQRSDVTSEDGRPYGKWSGVLPSSALDLRKCCRE